MTGPGLRGGDAHGRHRYDPVSTVDVAATILDVADAEPPAVQDGVSRLPVLRSGDRGWTVPVLHESLHTGRGGRPGFADARTAIGVRTARYSLLLYRNGAELYDLLTDPTQDHNRWRSAAHAPVRRALLDVWWRLKDCRGARCQAALPDGLVTGAAENRRLTRGYWRAIDRVYGR